MQYGHAINLYGHAINLHMSGTIYTMNSFTMHIFERGRDWFIFSLVMAAGGQLDGL